MRPVELWRRDPRPGTLALALGVVALGSVGLLFALLLYRPLVAMDIGISEAIRGADSLAADRFFMAVARLGDASVVAVLALVAVLVLLVKSRLPEALLLGAGVGGGSLLGAVARSLFDRERPGAEVAKILVAERYGFPSGDALQVFLLLGIGALIFALEARRLSYKVWVLTLCALISGLVAYAQVYLGVHWLGDVVASWIFGVLWMILCIAGYLAFPSNFSSPKARPRRKKESETGRLSIHSGQDHHES